MLCDCAEELGMGWVWIEGAGGGRGVRFVGNDGVWGFVVRVRVRVNAVWFVY
jgi:hypothetical protein